MRKLLNTSLDALAYAVFCGLVMLVIVYTTPGKAAPPSSCSGLLPVGAHCGEPPHLPVSIPEGRQ